jgi:hypothetical protein
VSPPNDERRPRAGSGVTVEAIDLASVPLLTPLARYLIGRVPPGSAVPSYGTDDWDGLADQDPRRAASVVIAAECWRDHCSPAQVALDLITAIEEQEAEIRRRIREASWDVADARDWAAQAASPSYAELQRRRSDAA